MALAMIYPDSEQGKQRDPELRKKLSMLGKTEEAGAVRLRQARALLRHSWDHRRADGRSPGLPVGTGGKP
jgi:hypothetical protein